MKEQVIWTQIKVGQEFTNNRDSYVRIKTSNTHYRRKTGILESKYNDSWVAGQALYVEKVEVKEEKKEENKMSKIKIANTSKTVSIQALSIGQKFIFPSNPYCLYQKVSDNQFVSIRTGDGTASFVSLELDTISPASNSSGYWSDVYPVRRAEIVDNNIEVVLEQGYCYD